MTNKDKLFIKVLKPITFKGLDYPIGSEFKMGAKSAARQIALKNVIESKEGAK